MGSSMSSKSMDEEDRIRRQNLEDELKTMQYSLKVTACCHYLSSSYYRNLDVKVQYASFITGAYRQCVIKLAWKMIVAKNPRLAPILATASTTSLLFTVVVNIPHVPNSPGTLHQLHFRSGIECQYLEKQVQFFAKSDVWNSRMPWTTLASRYENLIKEKKEVNGRVQTDEWAYRAALKKIESRDKEKRQKEQELQTETLRGQRE